MLPLRQFVQESRATFALAVPLMAGQLSQMLMGLVDSAMVGHLGVVPLAAAAFANSVIGVPLLIGIGLMMAISVEVSRAHGAGEQAQTGEVLRHGIVLSLAVGGVLVALCWVASGFLHRLGQSPDVAAQARVYFLIIAVSLIPTLVSLALKQFSEALHHPWPPTLILLASVPLNGFLNWLLIYGKWGCPALGLEGAAWATLLARVAGLVALWIYVSRARRFAQHIPGRWTEPFSHTGFISQLKIGAPAAAMLLLESSAFSIAALMMGWLGATPLAAHQIAISCAAASFMLPLGLSMATTIRVGQAVGAGDHVRIRRIGTSSLVLGALIMLACGVVLATAGRGISRMFVNDPAVIDIAVQLLLAAAAFQVFDGIQVVASGALRGIADVNVPTALCAVAYWAIALPAAYLLAFRMGYGPPGIWIGLLFGLFTAGTLLTLRFLLRTRVPPAHPRPQPAT
jgi:MATE family multidrug resistance protein